MTQQVKWLLVTLPVFHPNWNKNFVLHHSLFLLHNFHISNFWCLFAAGTWLKCEGFHTLSSSSVFSSAVSLVPKFPFVFMLTDLCTVVPWFLVFCVTLNSWTTERTWFIHCEYSDQTKQFILNSRSGGRLSKLPEAGNFP